MKIAVVNDRFTLAGAGGGQYRVLGIARELARRGFDVTLCCPHWTSTSLYDFTDCPPPRTWISNQYANSVKLVSSLKRSGRFDAVYVQLPVPVTKAAAAYYANLVGSRVFIDFGDIWYSDDTNTLHRMLSTFAVKNVCGIADKTSAATITLKEELEKMCENLDVIYVPCGVDLNLFDPEKVAEADIPARRGRPVVLYQGAVSRFTGCSYLVDVARKVIAEAHRDILFLIVGDGPYLEEMRTEVVACGLSDFFIFTGRVPHHNVPSFIAAADVCLAPFPSRRDVMIGVFPIKVVEYMAMGKTVLASDIPSVRRILSNGQNGFLAPTPEFAEILLKLLDDPQLRRDIGARARATAKSEYDWHVIVENLLRFWF